MSVMYCDHCHIYVDTDFNAEHFDANGECVDTILEQMQESEASEQEIQDYLNTL